MDEDVNGIAATELGVPSTPPIAADAQSAVYQRRVATWESEGGRLSPVEPPISAATRSKHPRGVDRVASDSVV